MDRNPPTGGSGLQLPDRVPEIEVGHARGTNRVDEVVAEIRRIQVEQSHPVHPSSHRLDQRPWLGVAAGRLGRAARTNLGWHRERLRTLGLQLESLDPARVLGRGYSYTTTADGRLVRSVEDVRSQDRILTRVGDGSIESTVDRVGDPGAGAAAAPMDL